MEKTRNSNLECLRIIAILMILCIHAFGLVQGIRLNPLGEEVTRIVNCICNMGVSCFILISGYFGVKRNWEKIIRLELMVIFFSFMTTCFLAAVFPDIYQGRELMELLIKSAIPVLSRKHWFYTCYICLLLLSPYINSAIERMSKRTFQGLLAVMVVLFCLAPSFLYFEIMLDGGKGLMNMIMVYLIGRYIRKYADFEMERWKGILAFLLLLAISYVSSLSFFQIGGLRHSFIKDNSFTNVGMAILLLYLFKGMKFQSKWINRISSGIFAVYILNVPIMEYVDTFVLKLEEDKVFSNLFPFWMALEIILVFGIGLVIEFLRRLIFGKLETKFIQWLLKIFGKIPVSRIDELEKRIQIFMKKKGTE